MSPTEWLGAGGVPLETGMRQDEVRGFEWSQVWIQRRKIRLNKTKTSSPRVVPLRDTSLGTLIGTPRHITSPRVFWHGTGDRYTCFADDFARSPAERGLPFRCHVLRHRFAFLFAQETGDLHAHQAVLDRKTIAHGDALLAPDRASDRVMNENVALAGTSAADLTGSID